MKCLKLYALLGSLTIASACAPQFVCAADQAAKPATKATKQKFDETKMAEHDRGVRLDQLLSMFQSPAAVATAHDSGTGTSHKTTTKSTTTKPANSTHVAHTNATKSNTKTASKSQPHKIEQDNHQTGSTELAVMHDSNKHKNNMLAVSHATYVGSDAVVSAILDRPGVVPKYKAGDRMTIKLTAKKNCRVKVFDYDGANLTQLYPNDYEPLDTLAAGQTVVLGGEQSKYTLDISGDGLERIFVYAYPESEDKITLAMEPVANSPFRSVKLNPDQYHQLVTRSRTYFNELALNTSRKVSVNAKQTDERKVDPISDASKDNPGNKVELVFEIEK